MFAFAGAVARGFAVTRGSIDMGRAQSSNSMGMILIFWADFMGFSFQEINVGEWGQMSSNPSGVSLECTNPDSAQ